MDAKIWVSLTDFDCDLLLKEYKGLNIQISLTLKTLDPSGDEPGGAPLLLERGCSCQAIFSHPK